jgi:hypothetical protein
MQEMGRIIAACNALVHYSALCAFLSWNETLPDDMPTDEADALSAKSGGARPR